MKTRQEKSAKSTAKRIGPATTVEEYFQSLPDASCKVLAKLRATIREVMPADAVEVISYGMPAFKRKRVLVWIGAFADHCSLFPTASVIESFRRELGGFSVSKGTVQFPLDMPIPAALVKKLVKARIEQDESGRRG